MNNSITYIASNSPKYDQQKTNANMSKDLSLFLKVNLDKGIEKTNIDTDYTLPIEIIKSFT